MRSTILLAALCLAACGDEAEQAAAPAQLDLQPLGTPEFAQYDIGTGGCAFVPEGGGFGAPFVTDGDKAFIKTNGSVAMLAKIGETYAGGGYSVSFTRSGTGEKAGTQAGYDAHLAIRDGRGETVYQAKGKAQCAA